MSIKSDKNYNQLIKLVQRIINQLTGNILKHLNVKFKGVNVLEDHNIRQGIKDFSDWPTIPQLYVKGEFIGGCDIVKEMFEKGELKKIFLEKGI